MLSRGTSVGYREPPRNGKGNLKNPGPAWTFIQRVTITIIYTILILIWS